MHKNFTLMILLLCTHLTTVQSGQILNLEGLTRHQAMVKKEQLTQKIKDIESDQPLYRLSAASIFFSAMLSYDRICGFLPLSIIRPSNFPSSLVILAPVKDYVLPAFLGAAVAAPYYYYINNRSNSMIETAQTMIREIDRKFLVAAG